MCFILLNEQQTLRKNNRVARVRARARALSPRIRILLHGGEPFAASAYLIAVEGRDLQGGVAAHYG
jgi:hypothetical protein